MSCLACLACAAWSGETYADEVSRPTLSAPAAPAWPDEAPADASGDVRLQLEVDETGAVVAVEVLEGPEVFHAAAVEAAWRLGFTPATEGGVPVASVTTVRFAFSPPLEEDAAPLGVDDAPGLAITVHADHDRSSPQASQTLARAELERAAGEGLAELSAQVPGVSLSRGSADIAKPIIRGLQERRLLVLVDGVRHESQKWGPDHAPEVDPFSAGEVQVIRGAAGVRYGPDAMGGVLLVRPPPLRSAPGVGGRVLVGGASNGKRPFGALRLDAQPEALPQLSLRVEGSYSRGASLQAPDYVLGNTGSALWTLGAAAQWRGDQGQLRLRWQHYDLRAGVFYGVRLSTPSEFEDQLTAEVPVNAALWKPSYTLDRPRQEVSHDLLALEALRFGSWGTVEVDYAFQINLREEYEQVRESVTGPQYDFTLRTHSVDLHYDHPVRGRLSGAVGVQGSFQENVYRGYALLPNFRSFSGGAYVLERAALGRLTLEAGARYDRVFMAAFLDEDDYKRHVNRGTLDGQRCEERTQGARCPNAYDAASATVGALLPLWSDALDLKLELSQASRAPDVDELYLSGSAPSAPVYALGYPDLGVEVSRGGSATLQLSRPLVAGEVSAYASWIDDFINFTPELNGSGEPGFEVTIRGTWPSYAYQAVDAQLRGADGALVIGPEAPVGLALSGALVRAIRVDTGAQLVGTPPDSARAELVARPSSLASLTNTEFGVSVERVASQRLADLSADFAPPPPAYTLVGLRAEAELELRGRSVRLGAQASNLLNARYREYTSLNRYYADQPGRDVRLRVAVDL